MNTNHNGSERRLSAFTLIELLIVVAIIAILAAIAVPNFLEAQTRSKVSHAKSDLRTYATALESYLVDYNKYPITGYVLFHAGNSLYPLSTPVAYLTSSNLGDPFESYAKAFPGITDRTLRDGYVWANYKKTDAAGTGNPDNTDPNSGPKTYGDWLNIYPDVNACQLYSAGPAGLDAEGNQLAAPRALGWWLNGQEERVYEVLYDPTNGTVSPGVIIRVMGETNGMPQTF